MPGFGWGKREEGHLVGADCQILLDVSFMNGEGRDKTGGFNCPIPEKLWLRLGKHGYGFGSKHWTGCRLQYCS